MSRATILVVEDDPNLLEGIRTILELDGYETITAENGQQALELLHYNGSHPDLIISDIMMPNMDGIELLKAVRKEPRWLMIPFIYLTAKGDKTDMQRGKRLGVDDYLIKPFEAEDLLIAVESRLRRHEALNAIHEQRVANLKRNILTILNHEFRTPLTFIVAYADMLTNHNANELSDQDLLAFLKGVKSGATRLRYLIENFILLVELETGDAARTFEWRRMPIYDAGELLAEAANRALMSIETERFFTLNISPNLPLFVADREYLIIALTQLVVNAFKFSPPDSPVILGANADRDEIHLWVQDFGLGIPEHELEAIWQLFYQVHREHDQDQGAGSGLAIVHGITRLHGGRISVQSEVNYGSIFTISLPVG
ncbi:MAG: response regulator [Chloroflexota bacterium]